MDPIAIRIHARKAGPWKKKFASLPEDQADESWTEATAALLRAEEGLLDSGDLDAEEPEGQGGAQDVQEEAQDQDAVDESEEDSAGSETFISRQMDMISQSEDDFENPTSLSDLANALI